MLLDRLLSALEVQVDAFSICEICPGWRLTFDPDPAITVHYVLDGTGVLRLAGGRTIALREDCFVVLPRGAAHSFEAAGDATREMRFHSKTPPPGLLPLIRAGDGESSLATACGTVTTTFGGAVGLFDHLPEPLVETFEGSASLRGRFRIVLEELSAPTLGTRALTELLLKECLVIALRRQLARGDGAGRWLAALTDERLATAVTAMLARPAEAFTLEKLAGLSGMSRSAFAEHFQTVLGQPPLEFLREVRLRRAARLLEMTSLPVKAVARSVGYASRSYFSRAFMQIHGVDPTTFRARTAGRRVPDPESQRSR